MESSANARVPRAFLFAVFAVATLVGALIAYFGVTGHLGWGIP